MIASRISWLALPLLFSISVHSASATAAEPLSVAPAPRLAASEYRNLSVEQLIDKLQEESQQGIGSHSTALAGGFIAGSGGPRFEGGILGSAKPTSSLALTELVRRGPAAMPKLLEHLDDKRLTRLVVGADLFWWYSDEYSYRHSDPNKRPEKVNTRREVPAGKDRNYTVRVGDLCFVAVGQIVNRSLRVSRYQPSRCLVINSPVKTPELAAAVRKDWTGLTVEQHRQSLVADACSKNWAVTPAALERLAFYYPETGEALMQKLFERPIHDMESVSECVGRLLGEQDPAKWKGLVADFRLKYGDPVAEAVPFWLWWLVRDYDDRAKDKAMERAVRRRILAQAYPEYDPYNPPFINAASSEEQVDLIRGLSGVQLASVEKGTLAAFRMVVKSKVVSKKKWYELDHLAFTCISQLAGRGYDNELRAFLVSRVKMIEAGDMDFWERCELRDVREWQKRLEK